MITNFFFLFYAYFSKNVGYGSVFSAEMNSACKNTPIRIFFQDLQKTHFSENFRTGYSMAIFMLSAKKLIYTNLAIFGFFPSEKHDSFGFRKFCLKFIEKITKKQKIMITNIFFLFFAYFSKNVGFGSVFSAEMNSAYKNTLIRVFLYDLQKAAIFPRIFEQAIQHGDFHAISQKIDIY